MFFQFWLRQHPWSPVPHNKYLFEGDLTGYDEPVAKPENCDEYEPICNFPLKPNVAGQAYLNLVKRDWNTTSGNGNVDDLTLERLEGRFSVQIHTIFILF